jgi:hypothetical protein
MVAGSRRRSTWAAYPAVPSGATVPRHWSLGQSGRSLGQSGRSLAQSGRSLAQFGQPLARSARRSVARASAQSVTCAAGRRPLACRRQSLSRQDRLPGSRGRLRQGPGRDCQVEYRARVLEQRGAGGRGSTAMLEPDHLDLRRRQLRHPQEVRAGRHRVRVRRGVEYGPQHGRHQHTAIDGGRRGAAGRDQREPRVGPRLVPAIADPLHGRRLVKYGHYAHSWPSSLSSASSSVPAYAPVDR